jgi:adenylate cyclase
MAFELLAGRHPWEANGDALVLVGSMLTQPPASLRKLRPEVPEGVASAIERTLAAKREDRFPRMADLVAALSAAVGVSGPQLPAPAPPPVADTRPGVAVLPFANLSDDKEQEYFSDGLTEDLITDLSHFSQLRVIARNSTFRYKGQAADITRVGKELGVRYVLEGSVRRAGEQVRITAKLVDAHTQSQVWAQRYDRPQKQLFDVQDELTRAIVSTLVGNVLEADLKAASAKAPHSLSAYELTLLGRRYMRVATLDDNLIKARDAYRQAIAADPTCADAYRGLAQAYFTQGVYPSPLWTGEADLEGPAALKRGEALARKAIELDPRSELSYGALGSILVIQGRYAEAIASMEHGLALNPNNPQVHVELCIGYRTVGRHEEAVHQHELSLELDPFPSPRALGFGAWALFMAKRYGEALEAAGRAVALSPRWRVAYLVLAATYVETDELSKAQAIIDKVLELTPGFNLAEAARVSQFLVADDRERWGRAMRLAGLPA